MLPDGKKKLAASSAISQSCRKRTGQVIAMFPEVSKTLHTPSGSLALSFVQFATRLLYGQRRFFLYRSALLDKLLIGNPNTSAKGWSLKTYALTILDISYLIIVQMFYMTHMVSEINSA